MSSTGKLSYLQERVEHGLLLSGTEQGDGGDVDDESHCHQPHHHVRVHLSSRRRHRPDSA